MSLIITYKNLVYKKIMGKMDKKIVHKKIVCLFVGANIVLSDAWTGMQGYHSPFHSKMFGVPSGAWAGMQG